MIELGEFIAETLKQIIDGVIKAQEYGEKTGAQVNPSAVSVPDRADFAFHSVHGYIAQIIDFDLAVTTSEGTKLKGGVGVFVGALGVGTQGQTDIQSTAVSRIKFSVPVFLPRQG